LEAAHGRAARAARFFEDEKQRRKKAFFFVTFFCCFGQKKVNPNKKLIKNFRIFALFNSP
jgi:hypothetical protein